MWHVQSTATTSHAATTVEPSTLFWGRHGFLLAGCASRVLSIWCFDPRNKSQLNMKMNERVGELEHNCAHASVQRLVIFLVCHGHFDARFHVAQLATSLSTSPPLGILQPCVFPSIVSTNIAIRMRVKTHSLFSVGSFRCVLLCVRVLTA